MKPIAVVFFILALLTAHSQNDTGYTRRNYTKTDTVITMRDGIKLYTCIYTPKDSGRKYPILMERTPYSCGPYGTNNYATSLGPNDSLMKEQYIFVMQDVRGRYMSEGVNEEVTPYKPNKQSNRDIDESSDTYDTIDWLLKFLQNNNGRVGIYGISYPGFYATASLPGAHPALKAVSPQAPVTDEFIGDDANHKGAFFLLDNFGFMEHFDRERDGPVKRYTKPLFSVNYKDAYRFYLDMQTIKATNGPKYYNKKSRIWNEYLAHDTYDAYWQARNMRPWLKNIGIPVLVVGGWFDAEDLFGALRTYEVIEKQNTPNKNFLVMGPWTHGAWEAPGWTRFATHEFGSNTSLYFQDSIETSFFNYYLKDKGSFNNSKATVFETGNNQWKHFDAWPPVNAVNTEYYLGAGGKLSRQKSNSATSFSEYSSDPAKPVPYTNGIYRGRNNEYMAEDQRFAATRPDVLVFETDTLTTAVTLAGKIIADLFVSSSGSDADFVVKLIDVLPDDEPNSSTTPRGTMMAGMQRLVRADVMRGKFRNGFSKPSPFVAGKTSEVKFELSDVLHTFKKGHRIMVQVQSSWFPLVDRNPQKFMRIPDADAKDFQKARIRIYHDAVNSSGIILPVLSQQ